MAALPIAALCALVVALLLIVAALAFALHLRAGENRDLSLRVRHQAGRIRWYRDAVRTLGADLRHLAEDRMRDTPAAASTWADRDLNTCRQIWAADGPDTPGSTR